MNIQRKKKYEEKKEALWDNKEKKNYLPNNLQKAETQIGDREWKRWLPWIGGEKNGTHNLAFSIRI